MLAEQHLLPIGGGEHPVAVVPDPGHFYQSLIEPLWMALGQILEVILAPHQPERALGLGFLPLSLLGELGLWAAAVLTMITGWDYMISGLRHAGAQDAQAAATLRGRS